MERCYAETDNSRVFTDTKTSIQSQIAEMDEKIYGCEKYEDREIEELLTAARNQLEKVLENL